MPLVEKSTMVLLVTLTDLLVPLVILARNLLRCILFTHANKLSAPLITEYGVFKVARLDPLQFLMATLAFLHLELSALRNLDRLGGSVTTTLGDVLDLLDDIAALKDLAKHNMTAVEPPVNTQ